jgi:hypothetical protein
MSEHVYREFDFYLDAWRFCVEHQIDMHHVYRADSRTWILDTASTRRAA